MAGGKKGFLNELDGDLVKHLRGDVAIADMVGGYDTAARIYAEMARQGQSPPYITYTQVHGSSEKHLAGLDGCQDVVVHAYAYGATPNDSRQLAHAIHDRMLPTQGVVGDGTKLLVCNGGIIDSGAEAARDGSDRKKFWTRLVLRMVISD